MVGVAVAAATVTGVGDGDKVGVGDGLGLGLGWGWELRSGWRRGWGWGWGMSQAHLACLEHFHTSLSHLRHMINSHFMSWIFRAGTFPIFARIYCKLNVVGWGAVP